MSPQPLYEGSNFSRFSLSLVLIYFFSIAILEAMKLNFIWVLIYISLLVNNIKHLFYRLIGHLCIFFGECLFRCFAHFLNWVAFLLLSCKNILYSLCTSSSYSGYNSIKYMSVNAFSCFHELS